MFWYFTWVQIHHKEVGQKKLWMWLENQGIIDPSSRVLTDFTTKLNRVKGYIKWRKGKGNTFWVKVEIYEVDFPELVNA